MARENEVGILLMWRLTSDLPVLVQHTKMHVDIAVQCEKNRGLSVFKLDSFSFDTLENLAHLAALCQVKLAV